MSSTNAEADYFKQPNVHSGDDGRGLRDVFVVGVLYDGVTYADTMLGIAVMANQPVRVLPGTEYIDQIAVMGDVRVEPKGLVMEDKSEYYQLKGRELPQQQRDAVEQNLRDVMAIAKRSDPELIGATMAMIKLSVEA